MQRLRWQQIGKRRFQLVDERGRTWAQVDPHQDPNACPLDARARVAIVGVPLAVTAKFGDVELQALVANAALARAWAAGWLAACPMGVSIASPIEVLSTHDETPPTPAMVSALLDSMEAPLREVRRGYMTVDSRIHLPVTIAALAARRLAEIKRPSGHYRLPRLVVPTEAGADYAERVLQ